MDKENEVAAGRPDVHGGLIIPTGRGPRRGPEEPEPALAPSAPSLRIRARTSLRRVLLRRAVFATVLAVAALIVSYHYGGLIESEQHQHLHQILAISSAVVFLAAAVSAVRSATDDVVGLVRVPGRLGDARASTLRLVCLLSGYIVVVLCALALVHVPVQHLLLGGVLTGVILGIAAQQVLANLFAGIMLLFARPFTIGDELTVRSGALGGPVIGRVTGMTLTYVTVVTGAGPVLLPNSAVLAAAVGPASEWPMVP
jgi:small-conductance mechanosensitive channel